MADTPLAKKLLIKSGQRVLVLNGPEGYLAALAPLPEGVELETKATETAKDGTFDVVLAFAADAAALDRDWLRATRAMRPGGVLWVAWPKQSAKRPTDLNRDSLWARLHAAGWDGVTSVSVSETWSALRFRPAVEVGGGKKPAAHG